MTKLSPIQPLSSQIIPPLILIPPLPIIDWPPKSKFADKGLVTILAVLSPGAPEGGCHCALVISIDLNKIVFNINTINIKIKRW